MERQESLATFFEQCEHLAALWRFDRVATTSEDVLFEQEDEGNFVESFLQFSSASVLARLTTEQMRSLNAAVRTVSEAMIEALKVPKLGTRLRMIRLLGRLGLSGALKPLLLILHAAESYDEREAAAKALADIGLPDANEGLERVAFDRQLPPSLRSSAIDGIARIAPGRCIDKL